jgi:hypothetical protein
VPDDSLAALAHLAIAFGGVRMSVPVLRTGTTCLMIRSLRSLI